MQFSFFRNYDLKKKHFWKIYVTALTFFTLFVGFTNKISLKYNLGYLIEEPIEPKKKKKNVTS